MIREWSFQMIQFSWFWTDETCIPFRQELTVEMGCKSIFQHMYRSIFQIQSIFQSIFSQYFKYMHRSFIYYSVTVMILLKWSFFREPRNFYMQFQGLKILENWKNAPILKERKLYFNSLELPQVLMISKLAVKEQGWHEQDSLH